MFQSGLSPGEEKHESNAGEDPGDDGEGGQHQAQQLHLQQQWRKTNHIYDIAKHGVDGTPPEMMIVEVVVMFETVPMAMKVEELLLR